MIASERSEGTPPVARHNEDEKPLLPTPELSNLSEILKLLDNVTTIQAKDVFASFIVLEVRLFNNDLYTGGLSLTLYYGGAELYRQIGAYI